MKINPMNGKVLMIEIVGPGKSLGKTIEMWPVDAKEAVKLGTARYLEDPTPEMAPAPTGEAPAPYDFNQHTVPELNDMVSQAGITDLPQRPTKADLVKALGLSTWRPSVKK